MLTITMVHHCLWMPFNFRLGVVFLLVWFWMGLRRCSESFWVGLTGGSKWFWVDFEWNWGYSKSTQFHAESTQFRSESTQSHSKSTRTPSKSFNFTRKASHFKQNPFIVSWNFTPLYVFTQNLDSKTFRTRYFVPYVQHVSQLNCEKTYFRFQIKIIIVIVFMIWDWMLKVFPTQFLSTVFFDLDLLAPPLQLKPTQNQLDFTQCILHE